MLWAPVRDTARRSKVGHRSSWPRSPLRTGAAPRIADTLGPSSSANWVLAMPTGTSLVVATTRNPPRVTATKAT
jgi:hypothetical protein